MIPAPKGFRVVGLKVDIENEPKDGQLQIEFVSEGVGFYGRLRILDNMEVCMDADEMTALSQWFRATVAYLDSKEASDAHG